MMSRRLALDADMRAWLQSLAMHVSLGLAIAACAWGLGKKPQPKTITTVQMSFSAIASHDAATAAEASPPTPPQAQQKKPAKARHQPSPIKRTAVATPHSAPQVTPAAATATASETPAATDSKHSATTSKTASSASAAARSANPDALSHALWQRMNSRKRYPLIARRMGLEGRVVLEAVIDPQGQLLKARVRESAGTLLDEEAISLLKAVTPFPTASFHLAANTTVIIPLTYSLER